MSGIRRKRIRQEITSDNEAPSDTGEGYIGKGHKAVAPKLTCTGGNGFFRGPVTYCKNKHGLCSICFGDEKECPITKCGKKAAITLDFLAELIKDLKLPVPCKFRKDGCDQENADEEVIVDHEIGCGYRKVPCFKTSCTVQPAMDFEDHIFSAHESIYGKCRDNPGKWLFVTFTGTKFLGAQKIWIDPKSGLRFRAVLYHRDEEKHWRCYTVVFDGKTVAKKYRAEIRFCSNDADTSLIFNCNVKCLDDWMELDASKMLRIMDDDFKIYNKGHAELGDHNKDKNGELTMPVKVDVKMKKLNVG